MFWYYTRKSLKMAQCSNFTIMFLVSNGGNHRRKVWNKNYPATMERECLEWVEKRTHVNHSRPFNRKYLPFLCRLKIRTRNLWIHMCWAFPAHAKLEEPSHSSLLFFLNHIQYTLLKRQEYIVPCSHVKLSLCKN